MKLKGWLSKLTKVKSSLRDKWKQRGTEDAFNKEEELDLERESDLQSGQKSSSEKENQEMAKIEVSKESLKGSSKENLKEKETLEGALEKSKEDLKKEEEKFEKKDSVAQGSNFWGASEGDDLSGVGQSLLEESPEERLDDQARRFFRVAVIAGVMMMGVFLLSRSVNWFLLVVLLWGTYLFLLRRKIQLGIFELARAVIIGGLITFLSFYLLAISSPQEEKSADQGRIEEGKGIMTSEEKVPEENPQTVKDSEPQGGGHQIINLFIELENYSRAGFEVGKVGVENDLLWTSEQANLLLNKGMSVTTKDVSRETIKKTEEFFEEELNWNQKGSLGLDFVAPAGSREVGYASTSLEKYRGVMCIIDQDNREILKVKCGFGPR